MTPAETAVVLAKASAFDRRTVGRADTLAWHETLADITLADALAAVSRHYAERTEWLMPAHVRQLAGEIDRERRRAEREASEAKAIEAERSDPTRRDRSEHVRELIEALRAQLPAGDPDKLRYGRRYWRLAAEHYRRFPVAEANPHYDPAALARWRQAQPGETPGEVPPGEDDPAAVPPLVVAPPQPRGSAP